MTNDTADEMNRYAIQQNNIGVHYYVATGDLDAALYHFRQALSAKLATEHRLLACTTDGEDFNESQCDNEPMLDGNAQRNMQGFVSAYANNSYNQSEAHSYDTTGMIKITHNKFNA